MIFLDFVLRNRNDQKSNVLGKMTFDPIPNVRGWKWERMECERMEIIELHLKLVFVEWSCLKPPPIRQIYVFVISAKGRVTYHVTRQKHQIYRKMIRTLKPICVINLVPLSLVSLEIYLINYFYHAVKVFDPVLKLLEEGETLGELDTEAYIISFFMVLPCETKGSKAEAGETEAGETREKTNRYPLCSI